MEPTITLTRKLGIPFPIFLAPMAGSTTPNLVAAVSNSGGLGSFGAAYMPAGDIRTTIHEIRKLTKQPFAINLFIPNEHYASPEQIAHSCTLLEQACTELNYKPQPVSAPYTPHFEEQMSVIVEEKVPVFSFIFGLLDKTWVNKLKKQNTLLIGTATNVEEAILLEKSGVDMIVAQGSEAGGHRGTFIGNAEDGLIGLLSLLPQITKYVKIPVIAAGGIMEKKAISAAYLLGASGVQMGTAFLTCTESEIHPMYKQALLETKKDNTILTTAFSGRLARGIRNKFIERMSAHAKDILPFPVQNAMTRAMRIEAGKKNCTDFMSMWAGQSAHLCKEISVAELIRELMEGFDKITRININNS
ncbi:NAD(P)H-dependent flavin oxidoreductase [Legionella micdadei]|uniref:Nitronate monooxygenase n=1 Tax=Legionella micdadei TaxID=451 RepID=A0A098GJD1_LEGMI|nr:nitronate monooxygenase [Legionella micdadei]ARG96554.1 nitronate monooxygenase [Legionella micdadei]ARG99302.1 nitronate monooxygenase [Legionella micdadei]KTD27375.1 2-nitropropane dioxygenase [Legionella micdadei]CEG62085.1 putative nitronate monooxygenase [Legionella micdadei]SCY75250.1 nitronate monooxygenase [Legionella micdadei]